MAEYTIVVVEPSTKETRAWDTPKREARSMMETADIPPAVAKRWIRERRKMTTTLVQRVRENTN